jgi:DNA repair exonuclease SbcCD ATPase subunit
MGRKAKFTQEEVFAAADAMAAEGQAISPAELLRRLGGGSFTTLYRHLESWRAVRDAQAPAVVVEMPQVVRRALDQAWQAAVSEAWREVVRVREQLSAELGQAQRQFQEALATIEALEQDADADATRLESLEAEVRKQFETIAAAKARQNGLETRLAERESQLEACKTDLCTTIEPLRASVAAAAGRESELREENARLSGRIEQMVDELQRQLTELAAREERERSVSAELAALRSGHGAEPIRRKLPVKKTQDRGDGDD